MKWLNFGLIFLVSVLQAMEQDPIDKHKFYAHEPLWLDVSTIESAKKRTQIKKNLLCDLKKKLSKLRLEDPTLSIKGYDDRISLRHSKNYDDPDNYRRHTFTILIDPLIVKFGNHEPKKSTLYPDHWDECYRLQGYMIDSGRLEAGTFELGIDCKGICYHHYFKKERMLEPAKLEELLIGQIMLHFATKQKFQLITLNYGIQSIGLFLPKS